MKMMKFFLFAAATVVAISCAKENLPVENENPEIPEVNENLVLMTFTASADMGEDTKVALDNGLTVWRENDEIAVINHEGTLVGTFKATEVNGREATFSAMVDEALVNLNENEADVTYYAVYPASAYKGNDFASEKQRLFINVPAVQTAVAGSFDPDAFVSIATNKGGHLAFKNICSLVKFSFNNVENIDCVKFTANGNTNLAGTGNVYLSSLTTHSWGDPFDGRSSSNIITLNAPAEGWKANTDYYFTFRPFKQTVAEGQTQDPAKTGINFYVECTDGLKLRKGENPFDAIRNKIYPIGAIDTDGKLKYANAYERYEFGKNIKVGNLDLMKSQYGKATLITNESKDKNIGGNGVYFVASDATDVTFNGSASQIVVLSLDSEMATIKRTENKSFYVNASAENDYMIFSNIKYETVMTSGNVFGIGGDGEVETILFNKCKIEVPKDMNMLYGAKNILNFNMTDCDVKLHKGTANKNLVQTNTENTYNTLVFKNNIFYSTDGDLTGFRLFANNKATISSLEFSNNTIAAVYCLSAYGYLTVKSITAGTITNNLLYLPDYNKLLGDNNTAILHIADKIDSHLNIPTNIAYYYGGVPSYKVKPSFYTEVGKIWNKTGDANPIPEPDYVNGVFTAVDKGNDKFSTFGAKR